MPKLHVTKIYLFCSVRKLTILVCHFHNVKNRYVFCLVYQRHLYKFDMFVASTSRDFDFEQLRPVNTLSTTGLVRKERSEWQTILNVIDSQNMKPEVFTPTNMIWHG